MKMKNLEPEDFTGLVINNMLKQEQMLVDKERIEITFKENGKRTFGFIGTKEVFLDVLKEGYKVVCKDWISKSDDE